MATSNRFPYLTSMTLNQALLDDSFDNLTNQLELIVEIDSPTGTLYLSDRNKYVGERFYEARLKFPVITRTIGSFLSPQLEFSQLQLEINNADKKFNSILPAGDDYDGWVGRSVIVRLGLRDVLSTYTTIFKGSVTDQGGFQRSVKSFTLVARDDFEKTNRQFPRASFQTSVYPLIESEYENAAIPIIYGDWTVNVQDGASSVTCIPVNGLDPDVNGETGHTTNIRLVVSENANTFFDTSKVFVARSDFFHNFDVADVVNLNSDNNYFELRQQNTIPAGTTLIAGEPYKYQRGDKIFCQVRGKDLGIYDDNIVAQSRDILIEFGGLVSGDFDANWNTYRDKVAPAVSAISTFKSRAWVQEPTEVLTYALSLLEQVRLEAFVDRNLKFKIRSLHLEDFEAAPAFRVKNWDLGSGTFQPKIDDRNNFNRAAGSFNFLPNRNENYRETPVYRNAVAVTQAGKEISKRIVFPNLYEDTVVNNQVIELLRIASAFIEVIETNLTWRALLLDIGNFVRVNVDIQGAQFSDVPAMIREIGYDPEGVSIPVKMWSFQMLPFSGHSPGFSGITGGSTAIITQE